MKHKLTLPALTVLWYTTGFTLDEASSYRFPPSFHETNPYNRDAAGKFVWPHAAAHDWLMLILYLSVCFIMWFSLRKRSEWLATFAFCSLLIATGFGSYLQAVQNVWMRLGWYVPDKMVK